MNYVFSLCTVKINPFGAPGTRF